MAWFLGHESCRKKHRDAAESIETLTRQLRNLELTVDTLHDYVRRQSQRLAKQIERDVKDNGNGASRGETNTNGLDPISARILERRSHAVRPGIRSEQG